MRTRLALVLAATALLASSAGAQGLLDPGPGPADGVSPAAERAKYSGYAGKMTQREFIQAKAAAKSARRNAVLEARQWYGYSQARPTTLATPFTGSYGAQSNGFGYGRASAYYAGWRTGYVSR